MALHALAKCRFYVGYAGALSAEVVCTAPPGTKPVGCLVAAAVRWRREHNIEESLRQLPDGKDNIIRKFLPAGFIGHDKKVSPFWQSENILLYLQSNANLQHPPPPLPRTGTVMKLMQLTFFSQILRSLEDCIK